MPPSLIPAHHGPPGARTLTHEAGFIIRGLADLHLKFVPAAGFAAPAPEPTVPEHAAEAPGAKRRGLFGFGKAKEAAPAPYATATTRLGALLADPAAKAVLDRHFPGVSDDARIGMGTIPPSLVDAPLARAGEASGEVPPLEVIAGMLPIKRPGTPRDIVQACEWLCSDKASYVTGQELNVNGGSWM